MSLVKKLLPGGSIDNESLNNELSSELATYKLPSKKERLVRDKLVELRDYFAQEGNTFSIDPLAKKYTISGTGSEKYQGSPDEVQRNPFTGGLQIKDDGDINSIAMAIYGAAHKRVIGSGPKAKESLGIADLNNYVIDQVYGTEDAFDSDFHSIKSDDERKKKILEFANNHINDYLTQAEKYKDKADYTDIDKAKAIQAAIKTGDWDQFKSAAYKAKWNPNGFLITDSEKERYAAEEGKIKADADKKAADAQIVTTKTDLTAAGFSNDLAEKIANAGLKLGTLKLPAGLNPNISTFITDYLKGKNAFVFDDASGNQRIYTNTGLTFNETGEGFDQFSPMSGLAWTHDPNTGILAYTKSSYKRPEYGNVGVELKGTVPGFEGYTMEGWSDSDITPEGGRDYSKRIILKKGNQQFEITKGDDGIYRSSNGQEYPGVSITGFGKRGTAPETFDASKDFKKFYDEKVVLPPGYNYIPDYLTLQSSLRFGYGQKSARAAANLVTALMNDPKLQNNKATRNSIVELLSYYDAKVNGTPQVSEQTPEVPVQKNGGILKAQTGAAFKAYKERQKNMPVTKSDKKSDRVMGDITGTFADQTAFENTMDAVSTAGVVGSFVPGYGAIGAGVTFGADLAKDLSDGKVDNVGTHLLNAGFIGLSFIGLGGLKALLKAGKVADKGFDIAKLADKAMKAEKVGKGLLNPAEGKALEQIVDLSNKFGVKTTAELMAKSTGADKAIIESGIDVLKTLKSSSVPILGSQSLGIAGKALATAPERLASLATSKPVRYGLRAASMAPGIMAVPEVASTIYNDGFEYVKPNDIKNIALAGSVGNMWRNDFQAVRAINRQATREGAKEASTFLKIGNEKVEIPKEIEQSQKSLIERMKGKVGIGKKEAEAEFDKFKQQLKEHYEKLGKPLDLNNLKKATSKDIGITPATKGEGYILEDFAKPVTGNRAIDLRDYELAKKHLGPNAIRKVVPTTPNEPKKVLALPPHVETATPIIQKAPLQLKSSRIESKSKPIQMVQNSNGTFYMPSGKPKLIPKIKKTATKKSKPSKKGEIPKGQQGLVAPLYMEQPQNGIGYGSRRLGTGFNLFASQNAPKISPVTTPTAPFQSAHGVGKLDSNPIGYSAYAKDKYWGDMQSYNTNWKPLVNSSVDDPTKLDMLIKRMQAYTGQDASDAVALINNAQTLDEKRELIRRLGTDGKIGPYHYLLQGILDPQTPSTPTAPSSPSTPSTPTTSTAKPPTTLPGDVPGVVPQKTPFDWKSLGFNPANLMMFMNTMAANRDIGIAQRRAVSDSLFQKPYMPQTYLRIDKPNSLFADKMAGQTRSSAGRIAGGIADIDKANAVRLQGEGQASDLEIKGQQADLNRFDQLRGQQLQMRSKVDEYNTSVLGENRARAADANSKIHLINANEINAMNTAANNYITAADRDRRIAEYRMDMNKTWNMMNDPSLKQESKIYSDLIGQGEYDKRSAAFDAFKKANPNAKFLGNGTFEESQDYKNYQDEIKRARERLELKYEPVRTRQQQMQFFAPLQFQRKGGKVKSSNLTKQDIMDIDNNNAENIKRLKSTELVYKAIIHNNEMLQRSLIKVFK